MVEGLLKLHRNEPGEAGGTVAGHGVPKRCREPESSNPQESNWSMSATAWCRLRLRDSEFEALSFLAFVRSWSIPGLALGLMNGSPELKASGWTRRSVC